MRTQLILVSLAVMCLILACSPPPATSASEASQVPVAVSGAATPTPTIQSLASCFDLLTPENNAELPSVGRIDFTWQPQQDAALYVLEMKLPDGSIVPFKTTATSLRRYAESTAIGGTYEWQVTAYDASGETLCTAGPLSYFKPQFSKPQKKNPAPQEGCPAPAGCTVWDPVACVCNG